MKSGTGHSRLPVVIAFLALIAIPMADGILRYRLRLTPGKNEKAGEAEATMPAPDALASYLQKRGRMFEESLTLRRSLIRIHNAIKYRVFGVSGVAKVIIGGHGWLFQARVNESPGAASYFPSIRPFSPEALKRWKRSVQERQRWLAERGIGYLFIPVPDKSSIYPEFLPKNLRPFYGRTRLDQLIDALRRGTSVPVLDARPALLAAKIRAPVYLKTDSHWNDFGARIVAGEIYRHFAGTLPGGKPYHFPGYSLKFGRMRQGGNLAAMLALEDSLFREQRLKLSPMISSFRESAEPPRVRISSTVAAEATQKQNAPFPGAVFLHDSFGRRLKPYLSEFFSRTVYVRDWGFRFPVEVIEEEDPAIVLDEVAEHFLYSLNLDNEAIGQDGI